MRGIIDTTYCTPDIIQPIIALLPSWSVWLPIPPMPYDFEGGRPSRSAEQECEALSGSVSVGEDEENECDGMPAREGSEGSDERGAWSPHLLLAVVANPRKGFEHIVGYYIERLPDDVPE